MVLHVSKIRKNGPRVIHIDWKTMNSIILFTFAVNQHLFAWQKFSLCSQHPCRREYF